MVRFDIAPKARIHLNHVPKKSDPKQRLLIQGEAAANPAARL
jgi:hypothetical protein